MTMVQVRQKGTDKLLPVSDRAHPLVRDLFEFIDRRRYALIYIAEASGYNVQTLRHWRQGRRQMSTKELVDIANTVGAEVVINFP